MSDLGAVIAALPSLQGTAPPFDAQLPEAPGPLFAAWFRHALDTGVPEPHVMALATEDASPDVRFLVVKDFDPDGRWAFASSAESAKGRQLATTPAAALAFWWAPLVRSVRIRGPVVADTAEASAANFLARTPGARAAALAGRQSAPAVDRTQLDREFQAAERRVDDDPGIVEPSWRKWWVVASSVEFWQGDPDRRHHRLRYERTDDGWRRTLLRPE